VKAVIFDFGGVFVDSPFAAVTQVAADMDVDPTVLLDVVFGSYDDDTDHPWHRLERGELSFDDARNQIMAASVDRIGPALDPFEMLMALGGGGLRDDMVEFVRTARSAGLVTGVLTNNAREFAQFWRPMLPLDELFDDVVDSSEVGMRKPDPRIYALAVERLGVQPDQALFVDDAAGNVRGAQAAGLSAVLIGPQRSDVPAAIAQLSALAGLAGR